MSDPAPLWEAILTLVLVVIMFIVLALDRYPPDFVMYAVVVILTVTNIISMKEALAGFANEGMVVVMVLFIISTGVDTSGALVYLKKIVFFKYHEKESLTVTLLRFIMLGIPSAFISNTPMVAIFIPVMEDFCRKNKVCPSKVMLPLSYIIILGGTLTLMGSSSNFVALGLAQTARPDFTMGIFDMGRIGLPVFIGGVAYVVLFANILLPIRKGASTLDIVDDEREYVISVTVDENSPVIGQTIENAGLRHIPGLFIVDIVRGNESMPAPAPSTVIFGGDRLVLAGDLEQVVPLTRARGLTLNEDPSHRELAKLRGDRLIVEAVVGNHTSLTGKTVRELDFRAQYEAAIIAVSRGGERITANIGDIVLRSGDALLLVTGPRFVNSFSGASSVFVMVRSLSGYSAVKFNYQAVIAVAVVIAIVTFAAIFDLSICLLGFFGVAVMMIARIIDAEKARRAVNIEVLLMISAGFGISSALTNSGAAQMVADALVNATVSSGPTALVVMFYIVAVVFNAIVTNNAAVAIMFPIALFISESGVVDLEVLVYVLMFAGSADFCTPIGYQTNLMVLGPGGYKFLDYTRFGFPLQVVVGFLCVVVAMSLDTWYITLVITIAVSAVLLSASLLWGRFFNVSPVKYIAHRIPFFRRRAERQALASRPGSILELTDILPIELQDGDAKKGMAAGIDEEEQHIRIVI